jgi:hypothetical protein
LKILSIWLLRRRNPAESQSIALPAVSLYIRLTELNGTRRYERVNRRNPQLEGGA